MATTPNTTAWIVDDEPVNRILACAFLRHMGWTTREFGSGQETLDAAAAGCPALMIVDVSMPNMSGPELVRRLRQLPASRNTRFVAYTAHCLSDEIDHMKQAGFEHVLTKPVSFQHMRNALHGLTPVEP